MSAKQINFTVYGTPQGKGRPKFSVINGHVNARTPDNTVSYENLIKTEYRLQCGNARFSDGDCLSMSVTAFYPIPGSKSNKVKVSMRKGEIRPTKKPDADNILKVVADSLNQIAYKDDAQIVDVSFAKFYSDKPRIEVCIKNL